MAEGMERMGVSHLTRAPMRSLSGGQLQRVYLAQVLARRADLIVLDQNLFDIPIESVSETRVLQTYFEGELVYTAEQ